MSKISPHVPASSRSHDAVRLIRTLSRSIDPKEGEDPRSDTSGLPASEPSGPHRPALRLARSASTPPNSLREAMTGRARDDPMAEQLTDEHPAAYKPIAQVMADQADQADQVEVVHELHQVVNLTGTSTPDD